MFNVVYLYIWTKCRATGLSLSLCGLLSRCWRYKLRETQVLALLTPWSPGLGWHLRSILGFYSSVQVSPCPCSLCTAKSTMLHAGEAAPRWLLSPKHRSASTFFKLINGQWESLTQKEYNVNLLGDKALLYIAVKWCDLFFYLGICTWFCVLSILGALSFLLLLLFSSQHKCWLPAV